MTFSVVGKPFKGDITDWTKMETVHPDTGLGFYILGTFVNHPEFKGVYTNTSAVMAEDGNLIETRNSIYCLVGPEVRMLSEADAALRTLILGHFEDAAVTDFMYYDRKEDEELPRGSIEKALEDGVVTVDDLVEVLRKGLTK